MSKKIEQAEWETYLRLIWENNFGMAKLLCDNIEVTYCMRMIKHRMYIVTYKGELPDMGEMESEFSRKCSKPVFGSVSKKRYDEYRKIFGKKAADQMKEKFVKTQIGFTPFWSSVNVLIKHLKANCQEIALEKY
jgi:hypothetical protein